MNGHQVLIGIAVLCELGACGLDFWSPQPNRSVNLIALGLVFYFISLLVPGA